MSDIDARIARGIFEDKPGKYRTVSHVPCKFCQAAGYLSALSGPEVKALMNLLDEELPNLPEAWGGIRRICEALAAFKKAVKP